MYFFIRGTEKKKKSEILSREAHLPTVWLKTIWENLPLYNEDLIYLGVKKSLLEEKCLYKSREGKMLLLSRHIPSTSNFLTPSWTLRSSETFGRRTASEQACMSSFPTARTFLYWKLQQREDHSYIHFWSGKKGDHSMANKQYLWQKKPASWSRKGCVQGTNRDGSGWDAGFITGRDWRWGQEGYCRLVCDLGPHQISVTPFTTGSDLNVANTVLWEHQPPLCSEWTCGTCFDLLNLGYLYKEENALRTGHLLFFICFCVFCTWNRTRRNVLGEKRNTSSI